jgi:hypothetical protein
MLKKTLFTLGSIGLVLVPAVAFAQISTLNNTISQTGSLVTTANTVLNYVIGLLITVAIIVFIYNVIKFVISKSGDDQKAAKSYMLYSVIAIAVILGIFGLANFLLNTFGIGSGSLDQSKIPGVPTAPAQY